MRARLVTAFLCGSLLSVAAGCATTSTGEPVFRLRPKADPVTGAPPGKWSGHVEALYTVPDFDPIGSLEYKSADSLGFRLSARPSHWYVAPEIGYLNTEEDVDGVDLAANEVFGGGRVGLRFNELPVEFYGSGGVSYIDGSVGSADDESTGWYAGGGVNLYIGSEEGILVGGGYRFVEHDWDFEGYNELQLHVGFAW
jgi:hypothetical protein